MLAFLGSFPVKIFKWISHCSASRGMSQIQLFMTQVPTPLIFMLFRIVGNVTDTRNHCSWLWLCRTILICKRTKSFYTNMCLGISEFHNKRNILEKTRVEQSLKSIFGKMKMILRSSKNMKWTSLCFFNSIEGTWAIEKSFSIFNWRSPSRTTSFRFPPHPIPIPKNRNIDKIRCGVWRGIERSFFIWHIKKSRIHSYSDHMSKLNHWLFEKWNVLICMLIRATGNVSVFLLWIWIGTCMHLLHNGGWLEVNAHPWLLCMRACVQLHLNRFQAKHL